MKILAIVVKDATEDLEEQLEQTLGTGVTWSLTDVPDDAWYRDIGQQVRVGGAVGRMLAEAMKARTAAGGDGRG